MNIILLVGPPGSGKSTLAKTFTNYIYINQDSQGKEDHLKLFNNALNNNENIIVDRMNFNKEQRDRYLIPAKNNKYRTRIIVLHESRKTCLNRMRLRNDHETIKNERSAQSALDTFFSKYERPLETEANIVEFIYPTQHKPNAIICDLDGTLCNIDHRLHYVKDGKKDWKNFFKEIPNDKINEFCAYLVRLYSINGNKVIYCSGRSENERFITEVWLEGHIVPKDELFMRPRNDYRQDSIIKEILLDFEILTRYNPIIAIDDRNQVVQMWRKRGITCLQVADGDF